MLVGKPNLFIVGQPKSGTSALYSFLKAHPRVCMCETKEPQFFCKDINSQFFSLSKMERTLKNYEALFGNCGGETIIGEASTAYLYSEVAAREIHKYNPDAKIIAMFREPVEFLFSYHRQMLRTSWPLESEQDFLSALRLEEERVHGRMLPKECAEPKFLYYSRRIKYAEQMGRFFAEFPRSQILVIIFEEFRNNNAGVFNKVMRFLEIDDGFEPEFKIVNPMVRIRGRRVKQFVDQLLFAPKRRLKPIIPKSLYGGIRSIYRRIFFSSSGIPSLSAEEKDMLKGLYRPEVGSFAKLVGRDLNTLWQY